MKNFRGGRVHLWVLGITAAFAILATLGALTRQSLPQPFKHPFQITAPFLADEIANSLNSAHAYPSDLQIPVYQHDAEKQSAHIYSTLDDRYGELIRGYLERYRPDYGAFAVINPDTGEILALETFTKDPADEIGHLAIRAPFPAASVFKIVTASAAIDQGKAYAETVIPYNGRNHTLYRKNVNDQAVNRYTQHVTLREAFGKSINVVFGKLGLFQVGVDDLTRYAENFHFNKDFDTDVKIEKSKFVLDPSNMWQLVESAAGFTNRTTMSPVHGALIAAAILNDGQMPFPHSVETVVNEKGETLYESVPKAPSPVMVSYSARQMQLLMQEVVTRGTSRKPFRGLANEDAFRLGGKTGSLDGSAVAGRTDWFVGYAAHDDLRLAVGVVTVNKRYWTIKSAQLARMFFEDAFERKAVAAENRHRRARLHSRAR